MAGSNIKKKNKLNNWEHGPKLGHLIVSKMCKFWVMDKNARYSEHVKRNNIDGCVKFSSTIGYLCPKRDCMGWRIPPLSKSTNFLSHQVWAIWPATPVVFRPWACAWSLNCLNTRLNFNLGSNYLTFSHYKLVNDLNVRNLDPHCTKLEINKVYIIWQNTKVCW